MQVSLDFNKALVNHWFGIGDYDAVNLRYTDRTPNGLHLGWTAGATAPTKLPDSHGISLDGGDLLTGATRGLFALDRISVCCLIAPTFAANDGVQHYIYDSSVGNEFMCVKDAVNSLVFYAGNMMLTVLLANYVNFWKVGQYNTLVFRGRSGDNQAFLNNNSIGTSATAWPAGINPANWWLGCRYDSTLFFAGRYYNHMVFPFDVTTMQATDFHFEVLRRVNNT